MTVLSYSDSYIPVKSSPENNTSFKSGENSFNFYSALIFFAVGIPVRIGILLSRIISQ